MVSKNVNKVIKTKLHRFHRRYIMCILYMVAIIKLTLFCFFSFLLFFCCRRPFLCLLFPRFFLFFELLDSLDDGLDISVKKYPPLSPFAFWFLPWFNVNKPWISNNYLMVIWKIQKIHENSLENKYKGHEINK